MKDSMDIGGETFDTATALIKQYSVSRVTIYRWRDRGLLPTGIKLGGKWYFSRHEVEMKLRQGE